MPTKSATAADTHVGGRIRERRLVVGLSQTALAERLGITFQQIQKYENGGNRISASRLLGVAEALEVPVSYFFEGIEGAAASEEKTGHNLLVGPDGAELLRAFNGIQDKDMRRAIISVAQAASQPKDREHEGPPQAGSRARRPR